MPRKKSWRRSDARRMVMESKTAQEQSPAKLQASLSPAKLQATQSPAKLQATQSPAKLQASSSPAKLQASQSSNRNKQRNNDMTKNYQRNNAKAYQVTHTGKSPKLACKSRIAQSCLQRDSQHPVGNEFCHSSQAIYTGTLEFAHELNECGNTCGLQGKKGQQNIHFGNTASVYCKRVVFGTFSQGDERFSVESRGSQCVINSLTALINAEDISNPVTLDKILLDGDILYNKVVSELKTKSNFQSKLLSFDEIPSVVRLNNKTLQVIKSDIISGVAIEQFGDSSLPTLHQSLTTAFYKSHNILIMIGAICSGVYAREGRYHFFDSHSHGEDALSAPDGRSVLLSFDTLDELVTYMYALYESMNIDLSSQFEVLPLHFTMSTPEDVRSDNTKNENQWKTVSYKKHSTQNKTSKQNCLPENKDNSCTDDRTTLIGRYFSDQKLKSKF